MGPHAGGGCGNACIASELGGRLGAVARDCLASGYAVISKTALRRDDAFRPLPDDDAPPLSASTSSLSSASPPADHHIPIP